MPSLVPRPAQVSIACSTILFVRKESLGTKLVCPSCNYTDVISAWTTKQYTQSGLLNQKALQIPSYSTSLIHINEVIRFLTEWDVVCKS